MKPITFYAHLFANLAVFVHAASYVPTLPFNMAVHFGPKGMADAWAAREAYIALVFAMVALNVAIFGLGPWIASLLNFRKLNIPSGEKWLSPDRIQGFCAFIRGRLAWFGTANALFFVFVNQLVFEANISSAPLEEGRFMTGLAVYFVFVIIWLLAFFRKLYVKR